MINLFVDDERTIEEDGWITARTVNLAVVLIERNDFDIISLDHDDGSASFMPLAYLIGAKYGERPREEQPRIFLHSHNSVGARQMQLVLGDFGLYSELVPFQV
jgi:hypothetical protein